MSGAEKIERRIKELAADGCTCSMRLQPGEGLVHKADQDCPVHFPAPVKLSLSDTLRTLAAMATHLPADVISVHESGVTVIVTNPISAARWREAFDARGIDGDVRLLEPIGVAG